MGLVEKPPTGLIPWFSKNEGNTYATLLHHPFLFKEKPTQAQDVAVLCSGFDLTVLDPSDRRGTDTYVSLLLRIKRWGLSLDRSCLHHVIVLIALLRFSMNLIH